MSSQINFRICTLCILLLSATACSFSLGGAGGAEQYYVLADGPVAEFPERETLPLRLIVREMLAPPFINSHKIVFRQAEGQRGFYQFSNWVEPPPNRLTTLMIAAIEGSAMFKSVSRESSSTVGELQLNTELLQLFHDATDSPGKVVLMITAELVDTIRRTTLARHTFTIEEDATSYGVEGMVEGAGTAVDRFLAELLNWVSENLNNRAAPEPAELEL